MNRLILRTQQARVILQRQADRPIRLIRQLVPGPKGDDGETGATGPNAISGSTATALNGLLTGTGAAVSVIAIPGGTTAFLRADGTFGTPPGVTFSGAGTHVTVTAQQANVVPIAAIMAAGQTANAFEVRDSTGVMRAAIGPQAVVNDLYALILKSGSRAYYLGTHDAGGGFMMGRDGAGGTLRIAIQDTFASFTPIGGLSLVMSTSSTRVVLCGREDGGASIIDLNRRFSDSSAGIGGTVNCWTRTSQTADALAVLAPGGGSTLTALKAGGGWQPASMSDAAAPNNTVYYSTTASKIVYKDGGGVVNNLY